MGLEKESAALAGELRTQYEDFFVWMQTGEKPAMDKRELPALQPLREQEELIGRGAIGVPAAEGENSVTGTGEPWLLESWDIEYFYGLSRPADVSCACPFGWIDQVRRIVDQQYPIFGVERFPNLFAKAAHVAWLLSKNQVFPEYNAGIAALAVLVLLRRNGQQVDPSDEELKRFILTLRKFRQEVRVAEAGAAENAGEAEEAAIRQLGSIIQSWA